MNRSPAHRYSLLAYLLILTVIGVIVLYLLDRSLTSTSHAERMELLLQLRQMDARLDRDVLRVSSLQLNEYDSLVDLSRQARTLLTRVSAPGGPFVGTTNRSVEEALRLSVQSMERKLEELERIKSQAAMLRNEIQYLPLAVEELARVDPRSAAHLSHLLGHLLVTNFFPNESDVAWLHAQLDQMGPARATQGELLASVLRYMRMHLGDIERLSNLRTHYAEEQGAARLASLQHAYDLYYERLNRRAVLTSIALMAATFLLFSLLALTLRRLHQSHQEAEHARLKLHDAVASLSEAFSLFDSNGRLVLFNQRFLSFYPWLAGHVTPGRHMDELKAITRAGSHLVPMEPEPDDRCRSASNYLQQTADGRWYLASDNPTSDGGVVCVRMDITESKQRELELRKLTRALEQSPVSVIITDVGGNIEYVNPKFEEATGYTAAEAIGNNPRMLKSGEKRPHEYRQMWETITHGREWRGTFLNRRKDGHLFWESASISPVRDEHGHITNFVAVKEDITQQKLAEETLRLHATVFETTAEGIMVTDASNQIRTVNPAFSRITGYTQDEVIGRDPRLLSSGRHGPEFYRDMWRALIEEGHWSGEMWNRRKDGKVYPEWLSIVALTGDDGKIHEFIAVFTDITQRKQDEEQILRQANFDALTGLPNRTLLFDRLSQAMNVAERDGTLLALLFIDLDRFKGINDALGHIAGDQMLRVVGERLRNCVRQSDTVARFGGDEFVIVLERVTSVRAVATFAEKVIRSMSEPFQLSGRELFIGASVGVSLFPEDARKAEALIRNADVAMYQAKEGGRSRYQFFVPEMNHRNEVRLELERGLRRALDRDQFDVEYQPVYDLRTGAIVKVEALLRWKHPELGLIRPERFIPLAEESGLIAAIGLWVLRTACAQTSQWRRNAALGHLGLAVNLSSRQWKLGLDAETIRAILADSGLPPEALTLEITEGMVLEDTEEAIAWLRQIRAVGVNLAVDDFGTGYSSLSYLKRFPVDELKIDYSFVRDLPGDEGSVSLVYAILSLARSLGLRVVAEGVETPEQLGFLTQAGCDLGQGFFLSGPQAAEEIPLLGRRPVDAPFPQRATDLFS